MTKTTTNKYAISALVLSGALTLPALAQTSTPNQTQTPASTSAQGTQGQMSAADNSSYATGKPLEGQSKEGFWGHVNPLARKKWVNRQVQPIKDRTNELDQLQSKNRNDIHDVDSRAQAGITKAMDAANTADQHAMDASNRANTANTLAGNANTRTDALHTTVTNLDQYQEVSSTSVPFPAGHTILGKSAKADLDDIATKLGSEKGYILEVQGYSRSGVQSSQAMADSVVRYLVTEHQVPVYRIYKSGLGKNTAKAAEGADKPLTNGVRVTLLHNSLASMGGATAATNRTPGSTSGVSNPPSN
jgi:outer membrane protein OmpA-like peptidoglycan-associated protein